ncbi:unnamed protein product [Sphagnum balticum]
MWCCKPKSGVGSPEPLMFPGTSHHHPDPPDHLDSQYLLRVHKLFDFLWGFTTVSFSTESPSFSISVVAVGADAFDVLSDLIVVSFSSRPGHSRHFSLVGELQSPVLVQHITADISMLVRDERESSARSGIAASQIVT